MQQLDSSSCKFFTIAYVANITFGLKPKQSIYNVPQMQLHNNINNKTISPFPKYSHSNTLKINILPFKHTKNKYTPIQTH